MSHDPQSPSDAADGAEEYPDYVTELAVAESHAERLLAALKALHGALHEAFPALRHDSAMQAAAHAIAMAEAWK